MTSKGKLNKALHNYLICINNKLSEQAVEKSCLSALTGWNNTNKTYPQSTWISVRASSLGRSFLWFPPPCAPEQH